MWNSIGSEVSTYSIKITVIEILHEITEDNLSSNTTTWNVSKEDDKGSVAKKIFIVQTV